jgi:hypothetical protein
MLPRRAFPALALTPATNRTIAALLLAALLVSCGGSVAPDGNSSLPASAASRTPVPNVVIAPSCPDEVTDYLDVLRDLDSRLSVGLNFASYGEYVGDARVAYDRIDVEDIGAACLADVAVPAEEALNAYVDAYNIWNECIGDVDCANESITPDLQAKWADATEAIESALDALDR